MAYNGIISPPVLNNPSGGDIQAALGESSGEVEVLCKSNNINKWARYKPVRHSTKQPITLNQRNSVYWGLSVPFFTSEINVAVYNIIQTPSYAEAGWGYLKPNGGDNAPYRQSDFGKTPNDPSGTPWVGNMQGYNHQAKFPMEVVLDTTGVVDTGGVWEANIQELSSLKFYFQNPTGDDLCIQDFIQWGVSGSNMAWRPFFFLYYGDDWYSSSKQPTRYGAGDAFSYTRTATPTLEVSLGSLNYNQIYHLCIGIGCCDSSGSMFPTSNYCKFIAPFNSQSHTNQFYYKIRVGNHNARRVNVTALKYVNSLGAWTAASGSYQRFTVPSSITNRFYIAMEIQRKSSAAYFVNENGTSPTPKLFIRLIESIGSSSTTRSVETASSSSPDSNPNPNYWTIPADSSGSTYTTVYMRFTNALGRGQTATYRIQTNENGGGWVDAGSFSVTRE